MICFRSIEGGRCIYLGRTLMKSKSPKTVLVWGLVPALTLIGSKGRQAVLVWGLAPNHIGVGANANPRANWVRGL
jgi:hypothetical protein